MNPFINRLGIFSHSIFASYSRLKPPKIAIIGNGGLSPEDQEAINLSDCVIRFNNYATRNGINYSADRFRCDILFTTGDLHSEGADPKSVVIGIPFPFKASETARKLSKWYPKARSYMVNPYLNLEMVEELDLWHEKHPGWRGLDELNIDPRGWRHPFPSIGFTCLWHLFHSLNSIPTFIPDIFVAGFNWYATDDGKIQGWDMKRTDYPSHWNHNYPKEIRWIIEKIMHHPRFSFSESSYQVLSRTKKIIS